jgi:hypothetical protein
MKLTGKGKVVNEQGVDKNGRILVEIDKKLCPTHRSGLSYRESNQG